MQRRSRKATPYRVQEPTTGLYAKFEDGKARLTYAPHASQFATPEAAIEAVGLAGISDQPHELVRIDA